MVTFLSTGLDPRFWITSSGMEMLHYLLWCNTLHFPLLLIRWLRQENSPKSNPATTTISSKRPSQPTLSSPSRTKKAKKGTTISLAVTSQKVPAIENGLTPKAISVSHPSSSVIPDITVISVASLPTALVSQIIEVLPDDETLNTGPKVAHLEDPQHTGAYPHECTMEQTSVNPSDNTEDLLGPSEAQAKNEKKYDMGKKRSDAGPYFAAPTEPVASATHEAETEDPRAKADGEVFCDIPTSSEAPIVEEVDAIQAEAHEDEDNDDEEGDSSDLPNSVSGLDDDDDDDDEEDFIIQYQHPPTATKGVALRDSASQGEQRGEEAAPEAN
ncbi:nucleolin-like [Cynara cardunculus var. scolymus]|uniref:nucleolin-like n=1 Tax=Cynara cardunculus var. scolymus TaxID=59895 RepID=UPI000D62ED7B|nr:nucleolin-like [Cynara cardunculus var. scolymus]